MFEAIRKVFGPITVGIIIGSIALVFIFYGVFTPRGMNGRGSGSAAATVNGEAIGFQEFNREYQQRVDFYQSMMKGKADLELLKKLGLRQQVLEGLIQRKLIQQEAGKLNVAVSDEQVANQIREMNEFKSKDGKFDASFYKKILQANRLSPAAFEEMVRSDLVRREVGGFVQGRAKVSDDEIKREFFVTEDQRQVDYVLISREYGRKQISISDKEIEEFLKTEAGKNSAKTYYEQNKFNYTKASAKTAKKVEYYPFEEIKKRVVTDLLRDRKIDEIAKINKAAAEDLLAKSKTMNSAAFKSYVNAKGLEMKTSEKFNRAQEGVAGLGESRTLIEDAFREPSPLAQGTKLYDVRGAWVLAQNIKAFKPNEADFEKKRESLAQAVRQQKEQQLYEQWVTDLRARAKVVINKAVNEMEAAE